ncbi:P-loop containing nucleoside triphosphate hydrolase protein [Martensiomyces pterosporus]|nr:P-loop containing nucleoside triphosphate hydrolase protein [Martensiomyces pterosporus]
MAEPTILAEAAATAGSSSTLVLTILLAIVLAGGIGWYVLNAQSAAISSSSISLASGGGSSASKKRNNTILITGPLGSGKTALWCQLRFQDRKKRPTQTSMSINASECFINEVTTHLVDVPGHQKYRLERDSHLQAARGVIFMVDAAAVADEIRQTAELLYDVLADPHVQERETAVLLLCNKQDEQSALSNLRIRKMLEDEIDKLRSTRQAGLERLGEDAADAAGDEKAGDFLGYDGKAFSFDDVPNIVQFNESSMVLGHDAGGLEQIERWIADTLHG